jgi:hypothetical protein
MSSSDRLRDGDLTPLERALLDAGTSYRSSANARAKTLAALGLAGSAAVAGGAAAAATAAASSSSIGGAAVAASKLTAHLTWAKVVVAASTLGAVAAVPAGYYGWQRLHRDEAAKTMAVAPAPRRAPAVSAAPAPPPEVPAEAEPAWPVVASDDGPARVEPRRPAATRSASDVRPLVSARLRLELAALDAARSALAGGDAADALDLLDRYARSYPRGRLAVEAEVLRIDAWAKTGRGDIARRRAEAFLRRNPGSVMASRVRGYLDD